MIVHNEFDDYVEHDGVYRIFMVYIEFDGAVYNR